MTEWWTSGIRIIDESKIHSFATGRHDCAQDKRKHNSAMKRPAPKLVMDDGSRVFMEDHPAETSQTQVEDLFRYFERIVPLIRPHSFVAVQFPDTLIRYMARVLEMLQDQHPNGLVFGLTGGCCPDICTAAHLNATVPWYLSNTDTLV